MFEILMYLFENYMDGNIVLKMDQDMVISELENVGFGPYDISRALDWLDGLQRTQEIVQLESQLTANAIRCYSPEEMEKLGITGRGLLLYFEQLGILDPMTREIVIDRLMALDAIEIDVGRIKWVVLIALFNQPDKKAALTLLQDMVLSDANDVLH